MVPWTVRKVVLQLAMNQLGKWTRDWQMEFTQTYVKWMHSMNGRALVSAVEQRSLEVQARSSLKEATHIDKLVKNVMACLLS